MLAIEQWGRWKVGCFARLQVQRNVPEVDICSEHPWGREVSCRTQVGAVAVCGNAGKAKRSCGWLSGGRVLFGRNRCPPGASPGSPSIAIYLPSYRAACKSLTGAFPTGSRAIRVGRLLLCRMNRAGHGIGC